MAYEIARCIGLPAAQVDTGIYNGRKGSMSYMLLNSDEELIEGIQYITKLFPNYDSDRFEDASSGHVYSIQMIMHALNEIGDKKSEFLSIPLFDCLIGNRDRHHSNWALIKNRKTGVVKFSPIYDNGSSLCCYVNPEKIKDFLLDKQRFRSLVYGKSKSLIGWDNQKGIRHFDLFEKLLKAHFDECVSFLEKIRLILTDEKIDDLVYNFDDTIMNDMTKKIAIKFISERRDFMITKYDLRKEANNEQV